MSVIANKKKCAAFTLIELVIVVGILAAMLLPALAKDQTEGHAGGLPEQSKAVGAGLDLKRPTQSPVASSGMDYDSMYNGHRFPGWQL